MLIAAGAAALLAATPVTASAERPAAPAPGGEAQAEGSRSAAGPSASTASDRWEDYSVEVYGMLVSRTGNVATLLPLVATTATPVAAGTKAVLFRKVTDAQGATPARWVAIARVTMKKIETTGNMQLTIDSEIKPAAVPSDRKVNYFAKGARLKLAIE